MNQPNGHLAHAVAEPSQPTLPENNGNDDAMVDSDNESVANSSKENDPSLSPTPVETPPLSPRKNALGKRPLSIISTSYPDDPDADLMAVDSDSEEEPPQMSPSDRNITANFIHSRQSPSPQRKSSKLTLSKGSNTPFRLREDVQIYEDVPDRTRCNGKENRDSGFVGLKERHDMQAATPGNSITSLTSGHNPTLPAPSTASAKCKQPSKVTKKVGGGTRKATGTKPKARIGVRRL